MKLLLLLVLLFCFPAVYASPPTLSPVAPGTASWSFGTRSQSDEAPVTHTFLLRNSTKAPLTIDRVAVSCDCVQVEIAEAPSLPVKVAPGQTVPVQVTVSLRRSVPGSFTKSAWIYPQGSSQPAVTLEIHGIIRE